MEKTTIVCAVTGSDSSLRAASQAAALAEERNATLVLVFAVDMNFLDGMAVELSGRVAAEALHQVGETILEDAARPALSRGVTAKKVLRDGPLLDVVKEVVRQEKASLLVIGHEPRSFFEKVVFKRESVEDHLQELKTETGVEVMVV
jgi:nucleotide-binding universal stress UspA family protein